MKNVSLVINAVFAVLIIILFALVLGDKDKKVKTEAATLTDSTSTGSLETLPIAYINVDSLLLNYQFAQQANEVLIKKEEDSRLAFNTKARQLQVEVSDFQRKLENNAFLSRDRAEKEQTRLMQKQQDLQDLDNKLTEELFKEQQKVNEQLRDTINNFLEEYNRDKKYEVIFSNTTGDNILKANPKYDITKEVVDMLNKRMQKK